MIFCHNHCHETTNGSCGNHCREIWKKICLFLLLLFSFVVCYCCWHPNHSYFIMLMVFVFCAIFLWLFHRINRCNILENISKNAHRICMYVENGREIVKTTKSWKNNEAKCVFNPITQNHHRIIFCERVKSSTTRHLASICETSIKFRRLCDDNALQLWAAARR